MIDCKYSIVMATETYFWTKLEPSSPLSPSSELNEQLDYSDRDIPAINLKKKTLAKKKFHS